MLNRIIALLVIVAAAVVPESALEFLNSRIVQFVAAFIVVAMIIVYDVYAGILLGVALMVAYFRLHSQLILTWDFWRSGSRNGGPMANLVQDYITPEHLESAQSNVFDASDFGIEMKGIDGVYGEPVYGAQGMDSVMPGFTKEKALQGDVFTR